MNDISRHKEKYSSNPTTDCFIGWNPFHGEWLDGLTENIRVIAVSALACLTDNSRNEKELTDALMQINDWQQKGVLATDKENMPHIVRKEKLGSQLNVEKLIEFLLVNELSYCLKKHELAALVLLQEINGLGELAAVAGKNEINPNVEYLTLKIARLHIAMLLLCLMEDTSQEKRNNLKEIIIYLFRHG